MPACWPGLGANGIKVASDVAPLLARADGILDFTVPAATVALAGLAAKAGIVHVIGTTGLSAENEKQDHGGRRSAPSSSSPAT